MTEHVPSLVHGAAAALLLGVAGAAHADGTLVSEDYYLEQAPVVLSATRLAQKQYEAPVAVTVIDRAMIDASGALDIPDLLRLVPGFQVARSKSHTVSATYHGLADEHAQRMQVLVDGRPVYGPALGGVRWTDLALDIEDVERIEVVRGPNAAAFGANTFLGAINIITQHASQVSGTELSLLRGNKDVSKVFARHGDKIGKLDYRVSLGYRRDEGFKSRTDLGPPDLESGLMSERDPLNDGMRVSLLNFRGDYQLSDHDTVEMQVGYNGGPRGEGRFDGVVEAPRNREVQSHFQQLAWRRSHADAAETRVLFYHTYMRHREHTDALLSAIASEAMGTAVPPEAIGVFFPGYEDETVATNFSVFEERWEIEAQHTQSLTPATRAVWGGSGRLDRVGGSGWFGREDLIENQLYRVFGNLEWRAYTQGTVNLGAMYEYGSQVGSQVSPRIALNHQLNDNHGLRTSVSRAYRLPTIYEEQADGAVRFSDGRLIDQYILGNTELEAERITSMELGYLGRIPELHLTLDVKLFHDTLDNRIGNPKEYPYPEEHAGWLVPITNGGMLYHVNTGELTTNGVETSLTYRPRKRTLLGFNWAYAKAKGSALDSFEYSLDAADWSYEDLSEDVPTHTYSVFGMHRLPGAVDVSALYSRVSAIKWLGDGDRLDAQDRLDLRLAKHFRYATTNNTVALVVQNALDEYLEFRDENVFDTRAYIELTLGFD